MIKRGCGTVKRYRSLVTFAGIQLMLGIIQLFIEKKRLHSKAPAALILILFIQASLSACGISEPLSPPDVFFPGQRDIETVIRQIRARTETYIAEQK